MPLVVLLSVLPGMFALEFHPVDENGALWGLKSLEVIAPMQVDEANVADGTVPQAALKWQPPLGSWLTALAMTFMGTARPLSLVLSSYIATVGLVATTYFFCRSLLGAKLGFWACVMLSCHGPLLAQVQNPAPYSLSILLAMLTLWAFFKHQQKESSLVSGTLLAGGIASGLCLLAGGWMLLVVVAILLLYVLGLRVDPVEGKALRTEKRVSSWMGWPALRSLIILAFTGFAVGGWWLMMMSWNSGMEFWNGWLTGGESNLHVVGAESYAGALFGLAMTKRLAALLGLLSGLILVGLWRGGCEVFLTDDERRRRGLQLLFTWLGCALLVWITLARNRGDQAAVLSLWEGFLLVPCVAFAAIGINEIAQRRVSPPAALAAFLVSLLAWLGTNVRIQFGTPMIPGPPWFWPLLLFVIVVAMWKLAAACRRNDRRQQFVLTTMIVSLLFANAGLGLWDARGTTDQERELAAFREELSLVTQVASCAVIHESNPPNRLWFVLRSIWPTARLSRANGWDSVQSQSFGNLESSDENLVVIDCSVRETRPAGRDNLRRQVQPIASPQYFQRRQLRAYLVSEPFD